MFANLIETVWLQKETFASYSGGPNGNRGVKIKQKYPSSYFIAVIYLFLRVSLYQELSHHHIRRTQDLFKGVLLIADQKKNRSLISRRNNQTSKWTNWQAKKKFLHPDGTKSHIAMLALLF